MPAQGPTQTPQELPPEGVRWWQRVPVGLTVLDALLATVWVTPRATSALQLVSIAAPYLALAALPLLSRRRQPFRAYCLLGALFTIVLGIPLFFHSGFLFLSGAPILLMARARGSLGPFLAATASAGAMAVAVGWMVAIHNDLL